MTALIFENKQNSRQFGDIKMVMTRTKMVESDELISLDHLNICRFCLNDQTQLYDLFDPKSSLSHVSIPTQAMMCLSVEIYPKDNYPRFICGDCRNEINRIFKFNAFIQETKTAMIACISSGVLEKPAINFTDYLNDDKERQERQQRPVAPKKTKRTIQPHEPPKKIPRTVSNEPIKLFSQDTVMDENPSDGQNSEDAQTIRKLSSPQNIVIENIQEIVSASRVHETPKITFPCPHCDQSFQIREILNIHLRQCSKTSDSGHMPTITFICDVCNGCFGDNNKLKRHQATHKSLESVGEDLSQSLLCGYCDKTFQHKAALRKHMDVHKSNQNENVCEHCPIGFATVEILAQHVRLVHPGAKRYACHVCSLDFPLQKFLDRHLKDAHVNTIDMSAGMDRYSSFYFKCSECTMLFKRKDALIGHSTIHSMVTLKCIFCRVKFDNSALVKEHVKSHMHDRVFSCEPCSYLFLTQQHMDRHVLTHLDDESKNDPIFDILKTPADRIEHAPESQINAQEEFEENAVESEPASVANLFEDTLEMLSVDDENNADGDEQNPTRPLIDTSNTELFFDENSLPLTDTKQQYAVSIVKPGGTKTYQSKNVNRSTSQSKEMTQKINQDDSVMVNPIVESELVDKSLEVTDRNVKLEMVASQPHPSESMSEVGKDTETSNESGMETPATSVLSTSVQTPTASTSSIDLPALPVVPTVPISDVKEMKIGDRKVKVQKVLMTKADVEQMMRDGRVTMNKGTLVLNKLRMKPSSQTTLPEPIPSAESNDIQMEIPSFINQPTELAKSSIPTVTTPSFGKKYSKNERRNTRPGVDVTKVASRSQGQVDGLEQQDESGISINCGDNSAIVNVKNPLEEGKYADNFDG